MSASAVLVGTVLGDVGGVSCRSRTRSATTAMRPVSRAPIICRARAMAMTKKMITSSAPKWTGFGFHTGPSFGATASGDRAGGFAWSSTWYLMDGSAGGVTSVKRPGLGWRGWAVVACGGLSSRVAPPVRVQRTIASQYWRLLSLTCNRQRVLKRRRTDPTGGPMPPIREDGVDGRVRCGGGLLRGCGRLGRARGGIRRGR